MGTSRAVAVGAEMVRCASQRKDWLSLVSVHSDTWLLAVAFYNGARLNREGRERLFELINSLPTVYEVMPAASAERPPAVREGALPAFPDSSRSPFQRSLGAWPQVVSNRVPREAAGGTKPKKRGAPGAPARPALGPAPKVARPVSSLDRAPGQGVLVPSAPLDVCRSAQRRTGIWVAGGCEDVPGPSALLCG